MDRLSIKNDEHLIIVQHNKMDSRYRSFCSRCHKERRALGEKEKKTAIAGIRLPPERNAQVFEISRESHSLWQILLCNKLVGEMDESWCPWFTALSGCGPALYPQRDCRWGCTESGICSGSKLRTMHGKETCLAVPLVTCWKKEDAKPSPQVVWLLVETWLLECGKGENCLVRQWRVALTGLAQWI